MDGEGSDGSASADQRTADPADQAGSPPVLLEPLSMQVYVSAERA